MSLSLFSKKCLGIDIGAASIKVVEVSSFGKKKKLENYAEFHLPPSIESIKAFHGESLVLVSDEVSEILKVLFKKAKFKSKKSIIALPDFSTFFTTFTLPPMSEKEIPQAIEFEARHHIPIPLSEVAFDWQVIEKEKELVGVKMKVLLVAVPNKVLHNYQRMATLAQLEVAGLEAEVFGLVRASFGEEKSPSPVCLVDIGWQSTTVSVVDEKGLQTSHSIDISGVGLTDLLRKKLNISFEKAEKLKKQYGLDPHNEVSKILLPEINSLCFEIEKICQDFHQKEGKKVEKILLAGGTALLFGLKEYLKERIKKETEIVNPFQNIRYPSLLKERLKEIGPSFAVALGLALRGTEI